MKVNPKHRTAILVFAHSSQEELKHKKISKGKLLFDTLTQNTIKTVKETGVPFFHFTEKLQDGLSFGERFSNAIQSVFDLGYENIITVGNDSPHLTKSHLNNAVTALDGHKLVLGPSADGGFYLMGLRQKDFEKAAFEKLSWQTSEICQEVLELFSHNDTECSLLSPLFDIDTFWDVLAIAKDASGLSKRILKALRSIISINEKIEIPLFISAIGCYNRIPSNKGSPYQSFS